jgi:hypothetical protein
MTRVLPTSTIPGTSAKKGMTSVTFADILIVRASHFWFEFLRFQLNACVQFYVRTKCNEMLRFFVLSQFSVVLLFALTLKLQSHLVRILVSASQGTFWRSPPLSFLSTPQSEHHRYFWCAPSS